MTSIASKTTEQLVHEQQLRALGPKTWHILHFIFSILTVGFWLPIWLLVTISNHIEREKVVKKSPRLEDTHVKCPDCRELVFAEANVCMHCGCKLIPQTV